jgi:hypothetical protein
VIFLEQPTRERQVRGLLGAFVRNAAFVQWSIFAVGSAMLAIAYLSSVAHGRGPIVDGVATEPFFIAEAYVFAAAILLPAWYLLARYLGTWNREAWYQMSQPQLAAVVLLAVPGIILTIALAPLMILNSASPCRR